jgi:hypothetical protein
LTDYEAHINTKYGQMVIHFSDKSDLERKLEEVTELTQLIESKSFVMGSK